MACGLCGTPGHTRTTCTITIRKPNHAAAGKKKKKNGGQRGWVRQGPPPAWILAARSVATVRSLKPSPSPSPSRPKQPAGSALGEDAERCRCGGVTGVSGTPGGARKYRSHIGSKRHMEWEDAVYATDAAADATPEPASSSASAHVTATATSARAFQHAAATQRKLVSATPRQAQVTPGKPGKDAEARSDAAPANPPPRSSKVKAKARSPPSPLPSPGAGGAWRTPLVGQDAGVALVF